MLKTFPIRDDDTAAPECLIALCIDGLVRHWGPDAQRIFGWPHDDAVGRDLGALIAPASDAPLFGLDHDHDRLNRIVEIQARHRDGRTMALQCCSWRCGDAATGGFRVSVRDVSLQHQANELLRRSESHHRAVVEHLGEGMVVIQDERIVFANRQAGEILRAPGGDLLGTRSIDLLHPDDRDAVARRLAVRQSGAPLSAHTEIRRLDPDHGVRWLATHSTNASWEERPATMSFFSDITARKALDEALHRSEERYRAVVEHVDDGMVVVKDQRFVFVNRRAAEIAQMSVEDMMREGYLHRIHPDDRPIVDERRRRRLGGQSVPNRYEIRLLLPDGTVRWVDIGVTIVPWEGELGTLTFFSDITSRKALQAQLQSTLQERETILQSSIVGIAFLTPEGRFRWANDAMQQIFRANDDNHGLVSMESIYESRAQYLHVGGQVAQSIRSGHAFETELRMRRLDGTSIWASLSGKAVNRFDLSQGTVWVVMDISRRKELESALIKTSSEREAILNSALVGIVLTVGRQHEWVNDKFAEMLQYSREELIGQSTAMVHPNNDVWERLGTEQQEALLTHGSFTHERQLQRRNGEVFWVQMAGRCVRDRDPDSGVIWTFIDITQRRQGEQDTRAALNRQRELNELRSRFVSMTSHEFRTPLAAILSSAELLRYYDSQLGADDKAQIIETIEAGVHRMTGMLERVLLIGRAEARMIEFKPAPMALLAQCRSLLASVRAQHADADCVLVEDFPPGEYQGTFDAQLLDQIFGNLLGNAIKYSPHGGEVCLRVRQQERDVVFDVVDHGIGIPVGEMAHLFDAFHRASNVGAIHGTGLGLAIVKSAVDLHGGSIAVHSVAGAGSRFTVRIPQG
jgi:PAS domain S-box-containing protein